MEVLRRPEQLLPVRLLLSARRGEGLAIEEGGTRFAIAVVLDPREDEARPGRPADPRRRGGALESEHEDVVELPSLGRFPVEPDHRPRRGQLFAPRRLHVGLDHGAQVADEVASRAMRFAPRPGGGQLRQPGEVQQPLRHLGLGGEEALAPQFEALDQAPHEDVGAELVHRRRGGPVEL
jgi:hypothetical protein